MGTAAAAAAMPNDDSRDQGKLKVHEVSCRLVPVWCRMHCSNVICSLVEIDPV